ncbi:peptidase S8 [Pseudarthrobacter phenanthrenivorans]|uniref:Peptidase S8 n=2 Tax=Pseudarthrobacter phenanthrenivorans TaxID=361575 RepID=A0A3B0FTM4_PSEPS|nr:S8 family serine peptidase [Pseudarthrobacter phenanthrenivorans]RKO26183.1 peptidase S8 [Pseudarthrobacter phenanthrenivorans]
MKKSMIAGLTAAVLGIGGITIAAPGAAAAPSTHVPGQILVKFRHDSGAAEVLNQHGLSKGEAVGSTGAHLIKVPAGKELQLVDALSRNPVVEYAEPDEIVTPAAADQYFERQYALQNNGQTFTNTAGTLTVAGGKDDADVDAVEAWVLTKGKGTKVAVLDSGVANDNPDITPQVVARANFTTGETGDDNYGHGTHVAGIVAAAEGNTIGVAGVCPECSILDGKVLNDSGGGSTSALANGINWATNSGAKVINMSLAVRPSRTLEAAVNNAWNKGAVLVAAAGNGNNQTKIYPGAYPNVIAVAATDNRDAKASFSTYGASWVDIAAPGVNVYSTFPNHTFVLGTQNNRSMGCDVGNGTSMSAPIVAATAALAWSINPNAAQSVIRGKVESTADRIAGTGTDWAHGRVNADRAVR